MNRDQLREQHQLSDEIAQAITSQPVGEQPDEDELDAELEGLEQEAMDERMLKTGTVPVADQINRLPAAANEEREYPYVLVELELYMLTKRNSQRQNEASRGRRRGSRARKAPCRNGHVTMLPSYFYSILCPSSLFHFRYSRPLFVFSGCMIE